MAKYLTKRVLRGVLTIFLSVTFTFFLLRLMPSDPVQMLIDPKMSEETVAQLYAQYGLDKPLMAQYGNYLLQLLQGNMGTSFSHKNTPVTQVLMGDLPWTLLLMGISVTLSLLIGIPVGMHAAKKHGKAFDRAVNVIMIIGISIFIPFLAFGLLYLFGYKLAWLPTGKMYDIAARRAGGWAYLVSVAKHAVLPAITLTISNVTTIILYTRNSMLDVQKEDYIRTALAKGWDEKYVTRKHAMKNAMIPTVTATGIMIASMVGGAIMTESIYSWQGVGYEIYTSVSALDYPVLQGAFLVLSAVTVIMNIITDLVLAWIDPRVKLGGGKA